MSFQQITIASWRVKFPPRDTRCLSLRSGGSLADPQTYQISIPGRPRDSTLLYFSRHQLCLNNLQTLLYYQHRLTAIALNVNAVAAILLN